MLRSKFQKQMETLNVELTRMGAMVEIAIADSVNALVAQDIELCNQVIAADKEINDIKAYIESKALKILLMQQPVASDLRVISTALKMVIDLERIGDQAKDICEIVLYLCEEEYQMPLSILPQMGETAKRMVNECIKAFVEKDVLLAELVIKTDDSMDEMFDKLKAKMIKWIREKPKAADQMIYFLMVGKYFEKIGDHTENIAKRIMNSHLGQKKP